jgi:tryptophan-rich sensory protein
MSTKRSVLAFVVLLVLVFSVSYIGSLATDSSVGSWYRQLEKPSWTPPSWLFAPVWTILYLLMTISTWLVWRQTGRVEWPLWLFGIHLFLNLLWSILFFGFQLPGWAFVEILFLIIAIILVQLSFAPIHRKAAMLLTPYLVWVVYASTLNGAIWWMN